jgi:hypothetical protein
MKEIKLWSANLNLKIKQIVVKVLSNVVKVYFKVFKHKDKHALYKWVLEVDKNKEGKLIQGAITKFPEEFSHILNAPEREQFDFKVVRGDNGWFIALPFGDYYISDDDIKVVTASALELEKEEANNAKAEARCASIDKEEYEEDKVIL